MKFIFELSKEDLRLAEAEVLAQNQPKQFALIGNLLFSDTAKHYKTLAYTKAVHKYLGEDETKINWQKLYKGSFCVRAHGMDERAVAGRIWHKLKNPKVNLTKPKTKIVILNQKYYAIELFHNEEDFEKRKNKFRPEPHPSSMNPKLARVMINLTGAKKGDKLLDPFCGSGGILIEAGFAGLKPVGSDIDQIMLNRAKINMKHYKLNVKLKRQDATTIKEHYKYIATDLPYGKSTKVGNVKTLLTKFLNNIKADTIVLGLPNFIKPESILKKSKYKIVQHFTHYHNKSLSKEIFVLRK